MLDATYTKFTGDAKRACRCSRAQDIPPTDLLRLQSRLSRRACFLGALNPTDSSFSGLRFDWGVGFTTDKLRGVQQARAPVPDEVLATGRARRDLLWELLVA